MVVCANRINVFALADNVLSFTKYDSVRKSVSASILRHSIGKSWVIWIRSLMTLTSPEYLSIHQLYGNKGDSHSRIANTQIKSQIVQSTTCIRVYMKCVCICIDLPSLCLSLSTSYAREVHLTHEQTVLRNSSLLHHWILNTINAIHWTNINSRTDFFYYNWAANRWHSGLYFLYMAVRTRSILNSILIYDFYCWLKKKWVKNGSEKRSMVKINWLSSGVGNSYWMSRCMRSWLGFVHGQRK